MDFKEEEYDDWVRSQESLSADHPESLTLKEDKELCEMQYDLTMRKRFTDLSLDKIRITVKEGISTIHWKSIDILLQFSTSYILHV